MSLSEMDKKLSGMSDDEKIGFIDYIEVMLDFGESDLLSEDDMRLYNLLIAERKESEKNEKNNDKREGAENKEEKKMNKLYVHNLRKPTSGKVKAYADVTVGDAVTLRSVRLMESDKGYYMVMPSRQYEKDGEIKYSDIFYPTSEESRAALLDTIVDAYINNKDYAYANGDRNPELKVSVLPVRNPETNIKAGVTLNIGDDFIVRNIKVVETEKGLMVSYPATAYEKDGGKKYSDLIAPRKNEWTDKDGNTHSKDYDKLIKGLIINEYKQHEKPSLSEQIANADAKREQMSQERDFPELGLPETGIEPDLDLPF